MKLSSGAKVEGLTSKDVKRLDSITTSKVEELAYSVGRNYARSTPLTNRNRLSLRNTLHDEAAKDLQSANYTARAATINAQIERGPSRSVTRRSGAKVKALSVSAVSENQKKAADVKNGCKDRPSSIKKGKGPDRAFVKWCEKKG